MSGTNGGGVLANPGQLPVGNTQPKTKFAGQYNAPDWALKKGTETITSGSVDSGVFSSELEASRHVEAGPVDFNMGTKKYSGKQDYVDKLGKNKGKNDYTTQSFDQMVAAGHFSDTDANRAKWNDKYYKPKTEDYKGVYNQKAQEDADKAKANDGGSAVKTTPNDDNAINDFVKNQGGSDADGEMGPPAPEKLGDIDEKLNKEVKTKTTGRITQPKVSDQPNMDKADTVESFATDAQSRRGNDLKLVNTSLVA
jgi:hypothetical protein